MYSLQHTWLLHQTSNSCPLNEKKGSVKYFKTDRFHSHNATPHKLLLPKAAWLATAIQISNASALGAASIAEFWSRCCIGVVKNCACNALLEVCVCINCPTQDRSKSCGLLQWCPARDVGVSSAVATGESWRVNLFTSFVLWPPHNDVLRAFGSIRS